MNKQQLFSYFQNHYLSRQEVLFKLPLNISIESFWPELLNWRKGHATMLPLYTIEGKPFWFVTTDRMIKASEALCEEALNTGEDFDPYRIEMTPAMSQEAYFTSYVEGAEYPLEEAVAFLRRGTDPENIYEQNILNNHQACSYMLGSLSVPFGEQFVKNLGFYLTEGQIEGEFDYRSEDTAVIPAMEGEQYEVPAAYSIPEKMAQFYDFLGNMSIHPLIKAAAAQAWIFLVRPFPEGNERLARMLSSAVLLRSGYSFFLDISISANIAHESFRYFKAMKEIVRNEKEGDMTYFIEYYLCLLQRALTAHRESRQQQAREAERQMAMQPLAPSPPAVRAHEGVKDQAAEENVPLQSDSESEPVTQEDSPGEPPMAELSESEIEALIRGAVPIAYEKPLPQSNEQPQSAVTQGAGPASPYQSVLHDLEYMIPIQGFVDKMTVLLNMGISRFTSLEWGEMHLVSAEEALADCDALYAAGIADRYLRNGRHMYLLRFESSDELAQMVRDGKIPPAASGGGSSSTVGRDSFWVHLASIETSRSDAIRRAAGIVRDMISEGIRSFTRESWIERTGMSPGEFASAKDRMIALNIVVNLSNPNGFNTRKPGVFQFTISGDATVIQDESHFSEALRCLEGSDAIQWAPSPDTATVHQVLESITETDESARAQRLRDYLVPRATGPNDYFTAEDWESHFQISRTLAEKDIRKAYNLGLLERGRAGGHNEPSNYRLAAGPVAPLRLENLPDDKKAHLKMVYDRYRTNAFSMTDFANLLNMKASSIGYRLEEFVDRGIFSTGRIGKQNVYRLTITPEDHPECFRRETLEPTIMAGVV